MTPLVATAIHGEAIFLLVGLALVAALFVAETVRQHYARKSLPLVTYEVVYPNGNRKSVTARDSEEAAKLVAGDANLNHDVVLYSGTRLVGVVRNLGKGFNLPTWFS